jgi:hypothetical protein
MSGIEAVLVDLRAKLQTTLAQLQGSSRQELFSSLHVYGQNELPNEELSKIAAENVDLLNSIEQLLTPSPLVLADHFLGNSLTFRP